MNNMPCNKAPTVESCQRNMEEAAQQWDELSQRLKGAEEVVREYQERCIIAMRTMFQWENKLDYAREQQALKEGTACTTRD